MNTTESSTLANYTYTGFFDGKPCEVWEGKDIRLSFGKMTTREMVESEEFKVLERAGFEVHRDWRDLHPRSKGGFGMTLPEQ